MSDRQDQDLEARLRAAAPAGSAPLSPGALAGNVLHELRQRRARRKARTSGAAALLLAGAGMTWWAQTTSDTSRRVATVTAAPRSAPAASLEQLAALRRQIEVQSWLVESLDQADRCAQYEHRLASLQAIDDPFQPARLELERAAWLMLDDAERRAASGASPAEQAEAYDTISNTLSGTYWAGVARARRQQLLGESGT